MTEKTRSFWTEWSAAFVVHLLATLAAFVAGAAVVALGARVATLKLQALAPYSGYLIFLFGSLGGGLGLWLFVRFSKFRPRFGRLDFDFRIREQGIVYIYRADKTIEYRKRKKLEALKNGMRVYADKYHWTGAGSVALMSGIAGQTVRQVGRRTVWMLYEIDLGKTLKKGDVIDTEVFCFLDDRSDTSLPFVSATIEEPADLLRFDLAFAPETSVSVVTCDVLSGIGGKKAIDSTTITINKTGSVTWEPPKPHPKLLHHYELQWVFPRRSDPGTAGAPASN